MERSKLFIDVLKKLDAYGLLEDLILIGSWSLYIYKKYFKDNALIPVKRTLDIDFLIPNPPKIKHKIDVENILNELGFDPVHNMMNHFTKYVHPELTVEFLMNQKGRGEIDVCKVKELSVTAIQLRYLSLLETNLIKIEYEGMQVQTAEPSAFTLHKYIVSGRRLKEEKAIKDLETAKEMSNFLLTIEEEKEKMKNIFKSLPEGWKKSIIEVVKEEHKELHEFLKS
ncbi:MAG: hypothetical protein JXB50_09775 [Spirochaetes bacterium]|nr:hypothetical protein [Spirochaetota bacterium]